MSTLFLFKLKLQSFYFFDKRNFCTTSINNDESVTVINEKTMRFSGIYVSDSAKTVTSVNKYAKDSLHLVTLEIVKANASSPLLDPP